MEHGWRHTHILIIVHPYSMSNNILLPAVYAAKRKHLAFSNFARTSV